MSNQSFWEDVPCTFLNKKGEPYSNMGSGLLGMHRSVSILRGKIEGGWIVRYSFWRGAYMSDHDICFVPGGEEIWTAFDRLRFEQLFFLRGPNKVFVTWQATLGKGRLYLDWWNVPGRDSLRKSGHLSVSIIWVERDDNQEEAEARKE